MINSSEPSIDGLCTFSPMAATNIVNNKWINNTQQLLLGLMKGKAFTSNALDVVAIKMMEATGYKYIG